MNSQQARNLVKQQAPVLKEWVAARCGEEEHLVPMALLYVYQRISDQDWQLIRECDEKQPFVEFLRALVDEALETFFYGVWFGECSSTIHYWISHYGIDSENRRQDAEDYIKNQLAKDNFSRLRSYNKDGTAQFKTYISKVIRNLLIDYLRKKTPLTETDSLENESNEGGNTNAANNTLETYKQQYLEEIGNWFFAGSTLNEGDEPEQNLPNVPDKLKLNHKERLFLRAVYKDGMTVEEAGCLPGIDMGKWRAHNYHRQLKVRIKKLLAAMGYQNVQSLLYPS